MTDSLFTSQGLVRELADFMIQDTGGHTITTFNPDWCESLACTLVGLMLDLDIYLSNQLGKIRGNLFFIFVAASGLGHKTVPLYNKARPMLRELTRKVNENIAKEVGMSVGEIRDRIQELKRSKNRSKKYHEERDKLDAVIKDLVDYNAPSQFTSEFLYTWLKSFPQGMIPGDEYTKMFRGTKTKDYLGDNMEILSRLYDCDPEKVGTQKRGVEYPENAYICFVSATTYYLLTIMDDDFFIQGTGNRIMWILDGDKQKLDIYEEAMKANFWWGITEEDEFKIRFNNLIKKLLVIRELPRGLVNMGVEAGIILDKYRTEKYNQAVELYNQNRINKDANLIARLAQNAMKLGLVHCVGRYAVMDPEIIEEMKENNKKMEVSVEDANWAIDKIENHFKSYVEMQRLAPELSKSHTKSYKTDQERILNLIDKFVKDGTKPTKTLLMTHTGWLKDDMQQILDSLLAINKIKMVQGRKYANKKVTHYFRV